MNKRAVFPAAAILVGLGSLWGASAATAADAYRVDPAHATVFFRVKHMGVGYCYGRFNDLSGVINLDEQNPAGTSVQLEVKSESVDTNNPKRDQHLKSPDFFSAKEFPTITFVSREVKQAGPQSYQVTGDLTLHGVTRTITVPLQRVGAGKDPRGGIRTGFEATFSVKRSDFGMKFMPEGIGDDVWLLVGFEAAKQ